MLACRRAAACQVPWPVDAVLAHFSSLDLSSLESTEDALPLERVQLLFPWAPSVIAAGCTTLQVAGSRGNWGAGLLRLR